MRPRDEDLVTLGLGTDSACEPSADEVKRAYHRRAAQLHPDAGGDPQLFCALVAAYNRALAAVTAVANGGRCQACKGRGKVQVVKGFYAVNQTCPACRGRGRLI